MSSAWRFRLGGVTLAAILASTSPLIAATLLVGPEALLKTPSAAAAIAQNGDTVVVAAGDYFDLTIEGAPVAQGDQGSTLSDRSCEGKASFITRGARIVLRNLTFTRIRVGDRNGAGVRVEGGDLTIEHSRFVDDQVGILAADNAARAIVIRDCQFTANGLGDSDTTTADILVGSGARLLVTQSRFDAAKGGATISSAAQSTELVGNRITSAATATYLVGVMSGGALTMADNTITLAPGSAARLGVVVAAADDDAPGGGITLDRNRLANQSGRSAILLLNWRGVVPRMEQNMMARGDTEMSDTGATLHRLRRTAHQTIDALRHAAGMARHLVGIARQQL
jgi:hypothetical protein